LFVSRSGKSEGVRQDGADGLSELAGIIKLLLQPGDRGSILLENQAAQRLQFRIPFESGERRRQLVIQASRYL
jgi:hypothetical protein